MNKKYIDGMSEIQADEIFKKEIVKVAQQDRSKQKGYYLPPKKAFFVVITVCVVTLLLIYNLPYIKNKYLLKGQNEVKSIFTGFTVTAYAADGTPVDVKLNVDFPLGQYQLTMSSVPGFPLKIACNDADKIKLTTTAGGFILWSPPDWQIYRKGNELDIASSDTVYWTPINNEDTNTIINNSTISLIAYKGNKEIGRNTIEIEIDNNNSYIGRLLE